MNGRDTRGIEGKVATMAWFARRPALWRQAGWIGMRRLSADRDSEQHQRLATAWCAERATSVTEALGKLGVMADAVSFEKQMADLYALARQRQKECPIEMGGPSDLTLLFNCAELLAAERVLETGVAYGWSTLAILASLRGRPAGVLHSVDMPYVKRNNEPYVGVVVPHELRGQWVLHRMPDRRGIPRAIRQMGAAVDMCHYDSDKTYEGRSWAYPVLWRALRPGGLLISDDIGDNLAFRDFAAKTGTSPQVVATEGRYAGVLRKQ